MSAPESPVTEFAFLNLLPPTTPETPKLVSGFLNAAVAQPSWSNYPLHLFHSTQDPKAGDNTPTTTTVYLISGWASIQAHNEWIASPDNQELLKFFGDAGLMSVGGLAHLDIDFRKLSLEECAAIVWRKQAYRDDGDGSGLDWGHSTKIGEKDRRVSDSQTAGSVPKEMAKVLWSYRGRAVDEGVKDEYELTGYSEGELEELGEEYTLIRKWNLQA